MATARLTIGSVFGAVSATANTLTTTLTAANQAAGMLNVYVNEAAVKQGKRSEADLESYIDDLLAEKAEESAERTMRANAYCDRSPVHAAAFNEAHARYAAILRKQEPAKKEAA
jgi:hypothetical protein